MKDLPDDMDYLKAEILRLKEHTGIPDEEEEKETGKEKSEEEIEA